jgi:acetyl/propionyl-CoA carboxylase alpha subunit
VIERIGDRCAAACKKIGYRGAGTFEFLFENGEFYFIEMNTRVQVEHPVTELVTGIDIVQMQIRVAAGEKLPFTQRRSRCAAMPSNAASTPRTRTSSRPRPAASPCGTRRAGPGVRVDSHAYTNYFVPPNYDSMIGKIIVHGDTREQALARMRIALSETVVEGIQTNIPLHRELMVDAKFIEGGTSIHYLEGWMASTSAEPGQAHVRTGAAPAPAAAGGPVSDALMDELEALSVRWKTPTPTPTTSRPCSASPACRRRRGRLAALDLKALFDDEAAGHRGRHAAAGAGLGRRTCMCRAAAVAEQDWVR